MFRGLSIVNLDAKGRLAVPTRYRQHLLEAAEGKLVVTIDTEQCCLLLYPLPAWDLIQRKLEALPSFDPAARRIQRLLMGHATDLELDSQGRVLLPQPLRDYASLDKNIVLVGQGKKFELWDEAVWQTSRDAWLAQHADTPAELSVELKTLSL